MLFTRLSVNESTSLVFGVDNCNKDCAVGCQEIGFKPVCGSDKRIYFSACFAGCDSAKVNQEDGSVLFEGCKCVNATSEKQTASRYEKLQVQHSRDYATTLCVDS